MTHHTRRALLGAPLVLWLSSGESRAAGVPVRLQIVTARQNGIRDLSLADLRQLYRGKRLSLAGVTSVPLNHPARSPDRVGFDRVVLGMEPDEVGRYWIDQKIRGGNAPPRTIDSVSLLLRVVARLPGAIAYVREGFSAPELKIVTVEGHLPGEAGYPIVYNG